MACGCSSTAAIEIDDDASTDASPEGAMPDGTIVDALSEAVASMDAGPLVDASTEAGDSKPPEAAPDGSSPDAAPSAPLTDCGTARESCSTSLEVSGGTFYRAYDTNDNGETILAPDGGPTDLSDPATVSGFQLDKYEVTVGRFRPFVGAWNNGSGYVPPAGSGKHTHLNGGLGLAIAPNVDAGQTYEPGWVASDDGNIAPTDGNLACDPNYATWTPSVGDNETRPMNCVDWWEAYAFCIWDGGFLPSEAEWEYAAAGGSQENEYPWGTAEAGMDNEYAIYDCHYPGDAGTCTSAVNIAPVGTATLGAGLWGQLDLLGNVWEWILDGDAPYVTPCTDCEISSSSNHSIKGGGFDDGAPIIASSTIERASFSDRYYAFGFRCARSP
jgi:formylglycine-generating enzyme required for sulfatase activity